MKNIDLTITFEEPKYWSAKANLGTEQNPETYVVFAHSLEELRELIKEGVTGDLGIEGIAFNEVFKANSEAFPV